MNYKEPSKLEMQVLSVLWARGASTVRDVMEVMPDGKTRAYTTILSVIQVMEKKGLVSHVSEGNAHVYQARVSRQQVTGPLLRGLVRQIFGGSAASALQHLLAENEVSRAELDEIKEIIAQYELSARQRPKRRARDELIAGIIRVGGMDLCGGGVIAHAVARRVTIAGGLYFVLRGKTDPRSAGIAGAWAALLGGDVKPGIVAWAVLPRAFAWRNPSWGGRHKFTVSGVRQRASSPSAVNPIPTVP